MQLACIKNYDRRGFPRNIINTPIDVKSSASPEYRTVILLDLSHSGLLIGCDSPLDGNELEFRMQSEKEFEGSIGIRAEIVRFVEATEDFPYVYGCVINEVSGF